MGLQFVFGGSGAGKSTKVYHKIIKQSMEHPQKKYFIMVPDQFTMYTQKELCQMHPRGGIMNVEVLSFSRLIHRVSEEVGRKERVILDDTGKNLILRKVAMEKEEQLVLLKEKVKRPGYIHEVKSVISEFYQYDIREKDMEEMIAQAQGKGALAFKMQDIKTLYDGFSGYIRDKFITTEESLDELCSMIPASKLLAESVIVFDGFTGFTPVQNRVLLQLMQAAEEVIVTLCADGETDIESDKGEQHLFALSQKTYRSLTRLAKKQDIAIRENIYLSEKPVKRYENNPAMAFLEANLFRYGCEKYEGEQQAIFICEADGPVSEIKDMCLKIKDLIYKEGYCYRDIAVVTGDLERYAHILGTEFARYQIPYFMDRNRGVMHNPLTEYLKSALNLLKDGFSYESVFRFLRSGMSSLTMDEVDRLENYVRAYGIRGKKAYLGEFVYSDKAEEMNGIRLRFVAEIEPILVTCKTAKEFSKALFELCMHNRLQEKCDNFAKEFEEQGDAPKAKEYEKIYPACMDLLNQIYELIGDDEMDVAEFLSVFEAGVAEIRVGTIPQNVDQVAVGDMERSRLKKIRALFFIGVNDGVIPGNGGGGGLLSDMERRFFADMGRELAPSPRQKLFEQRLYLYQNMTKPLDKLFLSYTKVDGNGKSILPSYLIRVMQGMYPALIIEQATEKAIGNLDRIATAEDGLDDFARLLRMYINKETDGDGQKTLQETLSVLCRAYGEDEVAKRIREAALTTYENIPLSDMAAELLYRDRNKGSVSRLEQFASCAYAHFLRYGLELKEQEEYDFESMDFGIVYHHVLEKVSYELRKRGVDLAQADRDLLDQLVEEALEAYATEYGGSILHSSGRNKHRIRQMEKVLVRSLLVMQKQLVKGRFQPTYFEKSFQLKGDFPLVGKIDRIDLCREDDRVYVKVVDYKSGSKKFSMEEVYHGLSLQLPAYMNAALRLLEEQEPDKTVVPAAMLYSRLQNPLVEESTGDVEREICREMRPDGISNDSDAVIGYLDEGLEGSSDVIRITRNKDGSLGRYSQTISEESFAAMLAYTEQKMGQLMEEMRKGEIGAVPAHVSKEKNDSCSFCAYRGVCGMDLRIPGYERREFKKITNEEVEEEMRNEVYGRPEASHRDAE